MRFEDRKDGGDQPPGQPTRHELVGAAMDLREETNGEGVGTENIPKQYKEWSGVFGEEEANQLPPTRKTDCN